MSDAKIQVMPLERRAKWARIRTVYDDPPRWINIDGMLHDEGARICECDDECSKCGGIEHYQAIYAGYVKMCERCERDEFQIGPMPAHDEIGIIE